MAAALLLGACTGGSQPPDRPTASAGPQVGRPSLADGSIAFGDCAGRLDPAAQRQIPVERQNQFRFGCGTLRVPLDHEHPDGERLTIAVARARYSGQNDPIGSLVLNPGGPGNPGLSYLPSWVSWLPEELLARFDIVTFDPRGTGASDPTINCGTMPEETMPGRLPDLVSASGFRREARMAERFGDACRTRLGHRAPFFSTEATARDLDLLRQALGDEKLSYVGFSYGARLGGEYAHRFPDRVRALVLDGPSDPEEDLVTTLERQVAGFEEAFAAYAESCPDRASCAALGDPREFVPALVEQATASPIPSGRHQSDVPAGGADVLDGVLALLYDDRAWPALDETVTTTKGGDSGDLWAAIDGVRARDGLPDDDEPDASDANAVINCNDDDAAGPTGRQIRATAARFRARYPTFGRLLSPGLLGCRYWPVRRTGLEPPAAPDADPVLVIGSIHDPATPYAGAVTFARTLGSGVLLTSESEGHTAFGSSTDCVNRLVVRYLIDLDVPPSGTRCPA
jgi:pimeloyl-ACP methyl ester carboxylesterase